MTQIDPASQGPPQRPEEPGTNRMLTFLVGLLSIGAVALLVLLVWMLWPKNEGATSGKVAGYPIVPVRSILGFGDQPEERLNAPIGVAFDPNGNVWVADPKNGRVLEFDQDGKLLRPIGTTDGPGRLQGPWGITFDAATNRAYVSDWFAGRIYAYNIDTGAYVATFPNAEQEPKVFGRDLPFAPYDVKTLGGRLVASTPNGLWFFDQDGFVAGHWGDKASGSAIGQFNFVNSFDVDAQNGRVYVADTLNKRVIALDSAGNVLWVSGSPDVEGKTTGFWQLPRGLTVGPGCSVYTVDTFRASDPGIGDGHIVVLGPNGELQSAFGRPGSEEGSFSFPDHIDYYPPDDLWAIADRENDRVLLFRLTDLPPPDESIKTAYEGSFSAGPFSPVAGASPSPAATNSISPDSCAGRIPDSTAFPWWILLVLLALLIIGLAIRRIRKDRRTAKHAQRAPLEGSPIPQGDASAGFDPVADVTDGGAAPTVEEPEQGP